MLILSAIYFVLFMLVVLWQGFPDTTPFFYGCFILLLLFPCNLVVNRCMLLVMVWLSETLGALAIISYSVDWPEFVRL